MNPPPYQLINKMSMTKEERYNKFIKEHPLFLKDQLKRRVRLKKLFLEKKERELDKNEKVKAVKYLHYYEQMTFQEIAKILNVTYQRIGQIILCPPPPSKPAKNYKF